MCNEYLSQFKSVESYLELYLSLGKFSSFQLKLYHNLSQLYSQMRSMVKYQDQIKYQKATLNSMFILLINR